jgi:hypothetical protein
MWGRAQNGRPRLRRARAVNRKTYARALSLTGPNSQLTPRSVRPQPDASASARAAISGMRPHVTSSLEDGRGPQQMFEKILTLIAGFGRRPHQREERWDRMFQTTTAEMIAVAGTPRWVTAGYWISRANPTS